MLIYIPVDFFFSKVGGMAPLSPKLIPFLPPNMLTLNITPIYIYIYIYEMGSSYTFFKPLDLRRSNGQKKTFIDTNILIDLIYYPLFNTFHTYF